MDEEIKELCSDLARQPDEANRRNVLLHSPHLVNTQVVVQLDEAVRAAVRVDVRKALGLAETALTIARELKEDEALALASRAKANALWFLSDCKSAVELFQEAEALFQRAGNRNEVARTLSSSIQSYALLGEYDAAFAAANKAREIFTGLGETWRNARLDINVANIFHRQNRYAEALAAYDRAYLELLPHRDVEAIGVALHNMAVCLIALDDFNQALETYRRVRDFCQQHEMPLLVLQADYNVAFLYYLQGDYTKALGLLRSTRAACLDNGDNYHLGLCDLDQSEIYLELGLIEEAAEMAQKSFEHFERLGMGFESARSLTNLAIAVGLGQDRNRALELFARAKEIVRDEDNQVWPNVIDLYRALMLLEQGDFAEARDLCRSTADFFNAVQMSGKNVLSLLLLVRASILTGELEQAVRHCTEASRVLETLDEPILSYQAQFLWGQLYEALNQPEQAYASYQQSRSALETLRSSLQREELKIGFMQNRLEVYTRLIQLCLDRDSNQSTAEEAFSYIEAAKSRTLRDLILTGTPPTSHRPLETEADRHVLALRKELNWYYHRIEREQLSQDKVSLENIDSLKREAKSREHELMRVVLEAPGAPTLGTSLRNSSTATLKEIRGTLGKEATLLEYFAIGERIFAAILTRETLKIVPLAFSSGIMQQLRLLQFQFSKFRMNSEYIARFHKILLQATQTHLLALYENLVAPIEGLLHTPNLVIVPFGPLHSLPFQALFDGRSYLVDRFSISYAPSASILAHAHRKAVNSTGPSLILGIEDSKTPFIGEEVRAVAQVLPEPLVLIGPDATEDRLREYGHRSRLVHIASHGYFRQDNPMFSSIALADSYLTLYDLYHMHLPVDLLTLSGCVTGLNVVAGGDELLGLTRGLLYAGARSLLLSLWEVDDKSTSTLMREFYRGLQQGQRKADALRAAMRSAHECNPHPYYWAPFKLIGSSLT
jgi:CHAT domain-containing protein